MRYLPAMIHNDLCLQKHLTVLFHLCLTHSESTTLHVIIIFPFCLAVQQLVLLGWIKLVMERLTTGVKPERALMLWIRSFLNGFQNVSNVTQIEIQAYLLSDNVNLFVWDDKMLDAFGKLVRGMFYSRWIEVHNILHCLSFAWAMQICVHFSVVCNDEDIRASPPSEKDVFISVQHHIFQSQHLQE